MFFPGLQKQRSQVLLRMRSDYTLVSKAKKYRQRDLYNSSLRYAQTCPVFQSTCITVSLPLSKIFAEQTGAFHLQTSFCILTLHQIEQLNYARTEEKITIIHKVFETNSSFHVKQRTTLLFFYISIKLISILKLRCLKK